MFTVLCKKACAETSCCRPLLTVGMSKAETVEFVFSAGWDNLTKTAVFTDGTVTVDVLQSRWQGNTVTIPAEVLTTAGRCVRAGVYGSNADGVVLPTIWADLGKVRPGAEPSGDASTDPALPVWAQLQEIIGDLDDLTTKAKNTLVAAINEAAKTGSGGSGSIDLRVADGYIQYSNDGGATWENLIALADLKGDDGAPGTPGTDGKDGAPGQDGYSPSASVSETDTGATITITDKTGTTTAEIKNGKDGKDGAPGKDGTNGKDGSPGAKGDPGTTPNLQIGTVTTLPAGSDATASMGGTAENPLLNLGIPKGADGSSGSSAITTDTETDIAGLLMGEGGKVRKAIPGTDYVEEKELPTPDGTVDSGKYLRWFDGAGWNLESLDLYTCNVVDVNGQYYCDQSPSDIQALVTAGKTIFAMLNGEPYLLTSISDQSAVFTRVAGTTVETFTVSADYTAVRATATIPSPETKSDAQTQPVGVDANGKLWTQPGGGSSGGGTDISLGVTGAAVGQLVKITAVDADGKPTAWEAFDPAKWTKIGDTINVADAGLPVYIAMPNGYNDLLVVGTAFVAESSKAVIISITPGAGSYGRQRFAAFSIGTHQYGTSFRAMITDQKIMTNKANITAEAFVSQAGTGYGSVSGTTKLKGIPVSTSAAYRYFELYSENNIAVTSGEIEVYAR